METIRVTSFTMQVEGGPDQWLTQSIYTDVNDAMRAAQSGAETYGYRTRVVRTYTEISELSVYSGA